MNDQIAGHQSSAAPPHAESVTQDVDGSNHNDNRMDTKATVQGTSVQKTDKRLLWCVSEKTASRSRNVGAVQLLEG